MVTTVPFPALPDWLPIAPADRPVGLRLFASDMSDLGVEFEAAERPRLVTRLLALCARTGDGSAPPEETIWELPLGTRIEAVLALAAGEGARPFVWRTLCCYPGCGAEGELELHAAEVAALVEEKYRQQRVPVDLGGRTAWLRRATGKDQRQWLEGGSGDPAFMAAGLFLDPTFDELNATGMVLDEMGDSIDEAMEEHDPLVGFHLEVNCPECGRATTHAPDLVAAALERLWLAQLDLIEQVHRLASHYHWTEEEISRIPRWRRQAYLARLDGSGL